MSEQQPGHNPEQYPQLSWGHALAGALEQMAFSSRQPRPEDGSRIAYVQREFRMTDGAELAVMGNYQGPRAWAVHIEGPDRQYGFHVSQAGVDVRVLPLDSEIPIGNIAVESLYHSIASSTPIAETKYHPER